jgi:hypothetical protein
LLAQARLRRAGPHLAVAASPRACASPGAVTTNIDIGQIMACGTAWHLNIEIKVPQHLLSQLQLFHS